MSMASPFSLRRGETLHAASDAVLLQRREIHGVDARILVLELDLQTARLDIDIDAELALLVFLGEGIAAVPERRRHIARGTRAAVEMLVEHLVRRREHPARLPVDAHEIAV